MFGNKLEAQARAILKLERLWSDSDQKIKDISDKMESALKSFQIGIASLEGQLAARQAEYKYLSKKIDMLERGGLPGGIDETKIAALESRIDSLSLQLADFIRTQECRWDGIDG